MLASAMESCRDTACRVHPVSHRKTFGKTSLPFQGRHKAEHIVPCPQISVKEYPVRNVPPGQQKPSCRNKTSSERLPRKGCSSCAQLARCKLVGTRRAVSDSFARNKNEKTAFRGRSEQDRSALCPACCYMILKTFRQNVFNGNPLSRNRRTRHAVSLRKTHDGF